MMQFAQKLTGIGTTMVVIGALLAAGCGKVTSPTSPNTRTVTRPASAPQRLVPNAPAARGADTGLTAEEEEGGEAPAGDAPAAAPGPSQGGLRPLPKVTPTPAPGKPGGGAEPDDVDRLLARLRGYGYHGSRAKLEATVTAVTTQYPLGWDARVSPEQHFGWWQKTLIGVANTPGDYKSQAIALAQHKFNVVYYVWVSKQRPNEMVNGRTPPTIDFDNELPIVKAIEDEGLLVQISPRGTVVDYLRMPTEYLNNWNHLIPIPRDLY